MFERCSVGCLVLTIEQRFGIACEAGVATVDGLTVDVVAVQGLLIVTADENRLDGAIEGACVSECPHTGRLKPRRPIGIGKAEDALGAAQSLHDAIAEELLDQLRAGWTNLAGLLHTPLPVVGEELSRIGWEMIQDRAPIPVAMRAHMCGNQSLVLEDRHGDIGRADPQCLTDEREGSRVQHVIQLDVAVAMQLQTMPIPQIRSHLGELVHEGLLDLEATLCLLVQVGQIPESAGRQEITLDVFNSRLNDALLPRIRRRTRVILKP